MINLELSNALAHDAKLVLSFITQRKYRDPRDPLRSLITIRVPPPMLFYCITCTYCNKLYIGETGRRHQVIDSVNTFATWKEMTRTHPNQSVDTLIFLIILYSMWQFAAFPYIQAVRKAIKRQNKNLSSKSGSPRNQRAFFIQLIYSCFLVTIFPPMAWLHLLHINPHTTLNSSNRSYSKCLLLNVTGKRLRSIAKQQCKIELKFCLNDKVL